MAQSNYTPIQLFHSTTPSATPNPADLIDGELAINSYDGILYYKDTAGAIQILSTQSGAAANIAGGATGSLVYQSAVGTTTFLNLGTTGSVVVAGASAPQYVAPSTLTVGTSTNIAGGALGSVPYQSAAGATTFVSAGANGQVLTISGGVPTWASAGTSTLATNIAGGTAGDIVYQSAPNTTGFLTGGTSGQLLNSNGTSAPSWVNRSSLSVGSATTASNIASGTLGAVPYQTGSGATTFLPLGPTNYVVTAGVASPQYVAQNTLSVGSATNLVGGSAGSVPYQTGSGTTAFVSPGTSGYVLTSTGTGAPTWAAASGGASLTANQTWTGTQTFIGGSNRFAEKLKNAAELVNVIATPIPSATTIYLGSGAVTFYTGNATSNFTIDLTFGSGVTLDSVMQIGEAVTAVVLVKLATSTSYYCTSVKVDTFYGTVTWLGGAPVAGGSGINDIAAYTFTIIKTALNTFKVLAAQSIYE